MGVPFTVRVTDAPELEQGPDPAWVALQNALQKARRGFVAEQLSRAPTAAASRAPAVLGCDTIVVLDGMIYGKPPDAAGARATIAALAGRTHEVISGLALLFPGPAGIEERTAVERTRVSFRTIDEATLSRYVATEEWRGRSGGYAIQGAGAKLAVSIDGEVDNVVGLPLGTLRELAPELFGRG